MHNGEIGCNVRPLGWKVWAQFWAKIGHFIYYALERKLEKCMSSIIHKVTQTFFDFLLQCKF